MSFHILPGQASPKVFLDNASMGKLEFPGRFHTHIQVYPGIVSTCFLESSSIKQRVLALKEDMPGRGRAIEPLHRTQLCRRNAHTLWLVILFDPAGGLDSNSLSWFILPSGPKPLLDPPTRGSPVLVDLLRV